MWLSVTGCCFFFDWVGINISKKNTDREKDKSLCIIIAIDWYIVRKNKKKRENRTSRLSIYYIEDMKMKSFLKFLDVSFFFEGGFNLKIIRSIGQIWQILVKLYGTIQNYLRND